MSESRPHRQSKNLLDKRSLRSDPNLSFKKKKKFRNLLNHRTRGPTRVGTYRRRKFQVRLKKFGTARILKQFQRTKSPILFRAKTSQFRPLGQFRSPRSRSPVRIFDLLRKSDPSRKSPRLFSTRQRNLTVRKKSIGSYHCKYQTSNSTLMYGSTNGFGPVH